MIYPVFPLNIVVLPDESVALHLFEARYRELFMDVKNGDSFVILFQEKNYQSKFGTLVYIEKIINEYPDDTADIIVRGTTIFEVKKFHPYYEEKLYSAVEGEEIAIEKTAREDLIQEFELYLEAVGKRSSKNKPSNIFQIANRLELSQSKKDELIQCKNNEVMNRFLINEIRFFKKVYEQEESLDHKFHLN